MIFDVKNERVDLTLENLEFYSEKLSEFNASLKETLTGKHPQDALALLIQIDDTLDTMKRWTAKHVTEGRSEKFWSSVAKSKANQM